MSGRAVTRRRADDGQVSIDFVGTLPFLCLAVMAVLQLTFAVSTVQATSAAARAGARAASQGVGSPDAAARAAVPSWLTGQLEVTSGGTDGPVTVTAPIPLVFPGFTGPTVTRTAWFEAEHGPTPWG